MKASLVEKWLEKTKSVFITESDPAFIFLFDTIDDANDAFSELRKLFGGKAVTLHVSYNQRYLNFTIIDEETNEIINANSIPFDNPYHFRLVKHLSNLISGTDSMNRKLTNNLKLLMGCRTPIGGFQIAFLPGGEIGFGEVKKFTTNLIQEP